MEWWQAIVLGLVEGITEYLPVSSTAHLLVAQRLMGIESSEAANAYAIVIQSGAIAAVLGLYRARVARIAAGIAGRDPEGTRLLLALVLAFAPAAVVGLAFDDTIERHLFGPWPIVAAWLAGGVLLFALGTRLERREGLTVEAIGPRVALLVGFAQCLAMWPGVSRSLATIVGGLAAGLSLGAAVEFSFLLGLVTLGAATAYKALDSGSAILEAYDPAAIAIGFFTAWLSAVVAVRWMVSWLATHGLGVFAWWRIGAALLLAGMLVSGAI